MTRAVFSRMVFIQGIGLTLLGPSRLFAQKWSYLGESNVDGAVDHDRIKVGQSRGQFRRIQLWVQNAAIRFDRVEVHFGNGTAQPVQIASRIPAGGKTREIDLPGERRWIDSVEFWYRRDSWGHGQKPKVRLMGIRW